MPAYGSFGQIGSFGDITTRGCCTHAPEGMWIPSASFGPIYRGPWGAAFGAVNWDKKCAEAQAKVATLEAQKSRNPIAWLMKGSLEKDLAKWRAKRDEACRLAAEAKAQRDAETAALTQQMVPGEVLPSMNTAPSTIYSSGNSQAPYVPQPTPKTAGTAALVVGGLALLGLGLVVWKTRR